MIDHDPLAVFLSLRDIKRDVLVVLARDGPQHGLKIKRTLDERMGTDINHGRLYPNLNELAEMELINKGQLTQRANRYEITDPGKRVLASYRQWVTEATETELTAGPRPMERLATQLDAPGEDSE